MNNEPIITTKQINEQRYYEQRSSGKQQTIVRIIFILKTNVLHSGIGGLRMRTKSPAYRAAYVRGILLTLAASMYLKCMNTCPHEYLTLRGPCKI
jgi:hypothetical protein